MKRSRGYDEPQEARLSAVFDFIKGLQFSVPLYRLREHRERRECPTCRRRRLYYCYDCLTVVHPECHPPALALPLSVTVILHPGELRGKSTSLAASTISPDLKIVEYPEVPSELDPANTLVLYPSADSVELHEVEHLERYTNVVFVDSTWQQSTKIARDERVTRFKHVRIKSQTSLFWRFQNKDPTYLATVEAIYYFLREYTVQSNKAKAIKAAEEGAAGRPDEAFYHGEVDDLLYYYINQYIEVQQRYSKKGETYTQRHFDGYVLEGACWDELVAPPASSAATAAAETPKEEPTPTRE